MAGEFIDVFPQIGRKGIIASSAACVVDLRVPLAHAACIVPALQGQVVLSWRCWRIEAVVH